ncbi:unnamed protein product, partial [marine sediment metagenome]
LLSINVIDDQSNFTHYWKDVSGSPFSVTIPVTLYTGNNTILITLYDSAEPSNRREASRDIYYDLEGPSITAWVLDHENYQIDNNQIVVFEWQNAEYGEDIIFNASIFDVAGVDRAQITVECNSSSCGSYAGTFDLTENQGFFARTIPGILDVGNYTVTFKAWDNFNNYNEMELWFLVDDTTAPEIILIPDFLPSPYTVYSSHRIVTGTTGPDLPVMVTILDAAYTNPVIYDNFVSGGVSVPKSEFSNMRMGDHLYGPYPLQGQDSFMFEEDWSGVDELIVGDYLDFSNHDKFPRYQVVSRTVGSIGFTTVTTVTFAPPLEQSVDSEDYTVTAYADSYPTGWFSIPVDFREGVNNMIVSVMEPSGAVFDLPRQVIYNTSVPPA